MGTAREWLSALVWRAVGCLHGMVDGTPPRRGSPLSANRNTVKALEQRGLIRTGKGRDPLTIVWHLEKKIDID